MLTSCYLMLILHMNLKQSTFARQVKAYVGGDQSGAATRTDAAAAAEEETLAATVLGSSPVFGDDDLEWFERHAGETMRRLDYR